MEKVYKYVPFNIELVKKIQSGNIEGRVVTVDGEPIRVLALDINDSHPIVVAVTRPNGNEVVYTCRPTGKYIEDKSTPAYDLVIELIEEIQNYEFKVGDKVRINEEGNMYNGEIGEVTNVFNNVLHVRVKALPFPYFKKNCELIESVKTNYNFKPFDRVLVRMCDEEAWRISLYGFKREDGTHCCVNTSCWEQCIPYEGNEHLLGTTNNPT